MSLEPYSNYSARLGAKHYLCQLSRLSNRRASGSSWYRLPALRITYLARKRIHKNIFQK
jgi:hypothetical protein